MHRDATQLDFEHVHIQRAASVWDAARLRIDFRAGADETCSVWDAARQRTDIRPGAFQSCWFGMSRGCAQISEQAQFKRADSVLDATSTRISNA